ncbi:MAG: ATP-dependent protease [Acidobacteria bacterium]|nr:ATP-dependent protease [Acidobacteriota bacterium]MEE2963642.1 LON peptidase substrate-binding domain-containing protein [Acidobacteriota bacterium]
MTTPTGSPPQSQPPDQSAGRRPRMTLLSPLHVLAVAAMVCVPGAASAQGQTTRGFAPTVLPATIPIFPLQDIMLFPRATRPLHIFEQRYRDMVADALEGDRLIGMVLLEPGNEADYEGRPPVYPVGTVGVIAESEELPDGRYNIVLGGLSKFRITGEDDSRSYRLAHIELIPEAMTPSDQTMLGDLREELAGLVPIGLPGIQVPAELADEDLVNGIAQLIEVDPLDRLGLLEQPGSLARAQALIDLMYIRAALPR